METNAESEAQLAVQQILQSFVNQMTSMFRKYNNHLGTFAVQQILQSFVN